MIVYNLIMKRYIKISRISKINFMHINNTLVHGVPSPPYWRWYDILMFSIVY